MAKTITVIYVDEALSIMLKPTVLDKKARGAESFFAVPAFINVDTLCARSPGVDCNQRYVETWRWRNRCDASVLVPLP